METLDVINEKDEVVGKVSKKEIYDKLLPHRIVHILIFNDNGEIALQLSSEKKDFCPRYWGTSVGGHVRSGESCEEAALREFSEELGTTSNIDFAYKDWYGDKRGLKLLLTTFKAVSNGPFNINSDEVEKVEFFSLDKIKDMIKSGEKFHPELLFLLKNHFDI